MTILVNQDTALESYYHYIMDYLDAKYDHHSVEPTFMPENQIAEINYYETQVRELVAKSSSNLPESIFIGSI
jgi:hypothetical protein